MRRSRRGLMRSTASLAMCAALPACTTMPLGPVVPAGETDGHALAEEVKAAMAWAWDNYRERAWGKDEIKPVSGTFSSFPLKDHHLGLTLIEALDTLWLMGLDDRFAEGLAWVKANAAFDVDGDVSVFETNIRLVGGLLSAHLASGDGQVLALAKDLADRLLPAFDTPTGIPYRAVNLKTGAKSQPHTSPADAGTFIAEWGTLSRLTGDPRYRETARRAAVAIFRRRSLIGLIATRIDAESGAWQSNTATVGSYCDSFFEYLWDGWDLFGDAESRAMYQACTAAIVRHQQVWQDGQLWFADVDCDTGKVVSTEQDELASFYGGLLAQGGERRLGAAYTESWAAVQDRYGVLPEGYDFKTALPTYASNAIRPELVDSAFQLWLLERNPRWREIGRRHFRAMQRWNKAAYGYTDLADVSTNPKRQADHCPGYWWSEQMKYYYLLFADTPRFDYASNYLSTEGNVLRGMRHPS